MPGLSFHFSDRPESGQRSMNLALSHSYPRFLRSCKVVDELACFTLDGMLQMSGYVRSQNLQGAKAIFV